MAELGVMFISLGVALLAALPPAPEPGPFIRALQELVYVAGSQLNRQDDMGRPWSLDRLRESAVLRLPLERSCRGLHARP